MKKLTIAIAAALAVILLPATPGSASSNAGDSAPVSAAKRFNVSISPSGGGRKVKAGNRLKVTVRCSQNCKVKVKFKLITPVGSSAVKGGRYLPKGVPWQTGMILTSRGRRILKRHLRTSRFAASISATSVGTGKHSKRTKLYRFRR